MNTYEAAPATVLLATSCACCGRALVDAVSVETGVGPECRKKHGFNDAQGEADWGTVAAVSPIKVDSDNARVFANKLTHRVACLPRGEEATKCIAAIFALGFVKLSLKLAERHGAIRVTEGENNTLCVKAPFSDAFNNAVRRIQGSRFDAPSKTRIVPAVARKALWGALKEGFEAGTPVVGTKGVRVL